MDTLKLKIKETLHHTCIQLSGDIIGMRALDLKQELKKHATGAKDLILDLTAVNEINLTALNSILISKAYASSHNNSVTLVVKEEGRILEHLHLTKMTDQFTIEIAV